MLQIDNFKTEESLRVTDVVLIDGKDNLKLIEKLVSEYLNKFFSSESEIYILTEIESHFNSFKTRFKNANITLANNDFEKEIFVKDLIDMQCTFVKSKDFTMHSKPLLLIIDLIQLKDNQTELYKLYKTLCINGRHYRITSIFSGYENYLTPQIRCNVDTYFLSKNEKHVNKYYDYYAGFIENIETFKQIHDKVLTNENTYLAVLTQTENVKYITVECFKS